MGERGWRSYLLHDARFHDETPALIHVPAQLAGTLKETHWQGIFSTCYSSREHITKSEGVAGYLGCLARAKREHSVLGLHGTDNSSFLGAVRKGRSSSNALNSVVRKTMCLEVCSASRYVWTYLRSKDNVVADYLSRIVLP